MPTSLDSIFFAGPYLLCWSHRSGVRCWLPLSVVLRQLPVRSFVQPTLFRVPLPLPDTARFQVQKSFIWFRAKTDKGIVCLVGHLYSVTESWIYPFFLQKDRMNLLAFVKKLVKENEKFEFKAAVPHFISCLWGMSWVDMDLKTARANMKFPQPDTTLRGKLIVKKNCLYVMRYIIMPWYTSSVMYRKMSFGVSVFQNWPLRFADLGDLCWPDVYTTKLLRLLPFWISQKKKAWQARII